MIYNFITFASDSYMTKHRVLEASIHKHHPESSIILYELGECPPNAVLYTLAKTRLEKVLEALEEGLDNVVLIGSDCELFAPINEVTELLKDKELEIPRDCGCCSDYEMIRPRADIILVPHILKWLPQDGCVPTNQQFYMTGHCNGDFMVFRNCENTKNILREMISFPIHDDKHNGTFYEQTWFSALPIMNNGVTVLKHSGYNVCYYNVYQRDFSWDGAKYQTTDGPLVMFHYSGFSDPVNMSVYQNRWKASGDVLKVYQEYKDRI